MNPKILEFLNSENDFKIFFNFSFLSFFLRKLFNTFNIRINFYTIFIIIKQWNFYLINFWLIISYHFSFREKKNWKIQKVTIHNLTTLLEFLLKNINEIVKMFIYIQVFHLISFIFLRSTTFTSYKNFLIHHKMKTNVEISVEMIYAPYSFCQHL